MSKHSFPLCKLLSPPRVTNTGATWQEGTLMASRPAGNREPSMREVTARPYFFSKRSRARACPGAELRVSSLPGPASPSSDSKVESQLNRTSSSQIKVKTGRRTGVVVSDHVRRDSNGLENLAEFWDEPASVKSCTASNMCSTTTSRHLNAVHSSSDMSLCGSSLQGGSAPNSRAACLPPENETSRLRRPESPLLRTPSVVKFCASVTELSSNSDIKLPSNTTSVSLLSSESSLLSSSASTATLSSPLRSDWDVDSKDSDVNSDATHAENGIEYEDEGLGAWGAEIGKRDFWREQEDEMDDEVGKMNGLEPSIGSKLVSEVKAELGMLLKEHLRSKVAPVIRTQLQQFVRDQWPALIKEKMAVIVRRHSELERRLSAERELERDRLFRAARKSWEVDKEKDDSLLSPHVLGLDPSRSPLPELQDEQAARSQDVSSPSSSGSEISSFRGDTILRSVASSMMGKPFSDNQDSSVGRDAGHDEGEGERARRCIEAALLDEEIALELDLEHTQDGHQGSDVDEEGVWHVSGDSKVAEEMNETYDGQDTSAEREEGIEEDIGAPESTSELGQSASRDKLSEVEIPGFPAHVSPNHSPSVTSAIINGSARASGQVGRPRVEVQDGEEHADEGEPVMRPKLGDQDDCKPEGAASGYWVREASGKKKWIPLTEGGVEQQAASSSDQRVKAKAGKNGRKSNKAELKAELRVKCNAKAGRNAVRMAKPGKQEAKRKRWSSVQEGGGAESCGARCSKRRRFRVLDFWRNERVEYSRNQGGLPEIIEVIVLSPDQTPFRPRKQRKRDAKGGSGVITSNVKIEVSPSQEEIAAWAAIEAGMEDEWMDGL